MTAREADEEFERLRRPHAPETNPVARTLEDASRSSAFWKAETIAGNTVIRKLRAALVHSVSVIQTWHNMGVPNKQASALWDLYWLNAPELKQIRDALAQEANELKASEPISGHPCLYCGKDFATREVRGHHEETCEGTRLQKNGEAGQT